MFCRVRFFFLSAVAHLPAGRFPSWTRVVYVAQQIQAVGKPLLFRQVGLHPFLRSTPDAGLEEPHGTA